MTTAFVTRPSPLSLRPGVRVGQSLDSVRCSSQSPSSPSSSTSPIAPESSSKHFSRRALLQQAAALGIASLFPFPSSAATDALAYSSSSFDLAQDAASLLSSASSVRTDYVFDSQSGSFLPPSNLDLVLRRDAGKLFDRCIVAAEVHNNTYTHAAQLQVIDSARRLGLDDGRPLMVGFEQFYARHNDDLLKFSRREMGVEELLQRTDWNNTWGFDASLYVPIFQYCQNHGIQMIGLNIPSSVTRFVAQNGIEALPDKVRNQLPKDMDFNNAPHFQHFAGLMSGMGNPHHRSQSIDNDGEWILKYYQVQVIWEEWMSNIAATYLSQNPKHRLVTLIGSGHVEQRVGFPDRLQKRVHERPLTIVPRPVDWVSSQDKQYSLPDIYGPEENVADLVWYTRLV